MKKFALVTLAALVLLAPAFAQAAVDNPWKVRFRAINVNPNDDSGEITAGGRTGSYVAVDSKTSWELDFSYMLNESWGLELVLANPKHDLSAEGGAIDGADLGSVTLLPPVLAAQYFFKTDSDWKPYLGAGINYTTFSYDLSEDLAGAGITDADFDSSFGFALNAGFDWNLNENWLLNVDLKYVGISTDVDLLVDADRIGGVSVDINPLIIGVGAGYRF